MKERREMQAVAVRAGLPQRVVFPKHSISGRLESWGGPGTNRRQVLWLGMSFFCQHTIEKITNRAAFSQLAALSNQFRTREQWISR